MIILQHALALFLIAGMPLWDWYEIPRLKANTDPRKKLRYYGKVVVVLWVCAAVAAVATGVAATFVFHSTPGEVAWLDVGTAGRAILEGITVGMLVAFLVLAGMAWRSEKIRSKATKAAKKLVFLLPSTGEERRWWWFVCITAGVCEEIVYRGFLLHYLHTLPFHLSLTWALGVSSLIFGIAHLYQGAAGAVQTAVIGFAFGCMFLVTGTLLVPMIVHAALDLRVLAMLPEGFAAAE